MPKLFISHTHADKRLADAFKQLMDTVFGGRVTTVYSSDESESGGIGAGEEWRDWINRAVRESEVALVLLTPSSVQKPWVLWEAGVVFGLYLGSEDAAVARNQRDARLRSPLRPLVFHLTANQVPAPFEQLQSLRGDDEKAMMKLVNGFVEEDFAAVFKDDRPALFKAGREMEKAVRAYVEEVGLALKDAPLVPTEPAVQEWLERIDALVKEDRASEVAQLHQWIDIAFGRENDEKEKRVRPIDVRIHRRLGQLYLKIGGFDEAIAQFRLAEMLVPRDLFTLHMLGLALLGLGDGRRKEATEVIGRMEGLVPDIWRNNAECAALKARYLRASGDDVGALRVLRDAFALNSHSYYLADLIGQACLASGDKPGAIQAYQKVSEILRSASESNVWTHATAATAAAVVGNAEETLRHLAAIATTKPKPRDRESILKGLERVHKALELDSATLMEWRKCLNGS
jgi:tetratricopeptide (TPR) repeat protein